MILTDRAIPCEILCCDASRINGSMVISRNLQPSSRNTDREYRKISTKIVLEFLFKKTRRISA